MELNNQSFYLWKQIRNVRSSQEALKVAVGCLDTAKSRAEVERWTLAAAELKEKADHMVLVLQVGILSVIANCVSLIPSQLLQPISLCCVLHGSNKAQ